MGSFFERTKKYLWFMNLDTTLYSNGQLEAITESHNTYIGSGEKVPENNIKSALNELSTKEKNSNSEKLHIPNTLDKQNKEHMR